MKTELSIIIVNWNGINFLPDCLKSIIENPPSVPYEIITVDNASTDESVVWLNSDEAREILQNTAFTLIASEENLGFSRGNNLAVERTDSPYVFFLNPDTVVKAGAINKLLQTLRSDPKIGAVAPKLRNSDGTLQPNVWNFPPTPLSILVQGFKLDRILPNKYTSDWLYSSHWNYTERTKIPAVSGAAILAKREMINKIGGAFDEDFHMFGEDVELCHRINKNGWAIYFEPQAEIYHLGGQSSIQRWGDAGTRIKEEEAFIYCQSKCLPEYLVFFNSLSRLFVLSIYYLKNLVAGNNSAPLLSIIKLHFHSVRSIFD